MRHAFDADHIAAIDNAAREFMADGHRPLSVGFWLARNEQRWNVKLLDSGVNGGRRWCAVSTTPPGQAR